MPMKCLEIVFSKRLSTKGVGSLVYNNKLVTASYSNLYCNILLLCLKCMFLKQLRYFSILFF